jgi:tRNA U34 2-thiouridine synthase MnmA/TrmU
MTRTAVVLFSGGLDSSLAVRLLQSQNLRVVGFHHTSVFGHSTLDGKPQPHVLAAAEELGIELHVEDSSEALLDLVRSPTYGHGKHLNPCIDCRIQKIQAADAYRISAGADFLATGEVLGQRPMSQNRQALERIDEACGVGDLVLRPLSAAHLGPTLPEQRGWVDRGRLAGIQGRSRTGQLQLAREYDVTQYSAPAGGCLLTEAGFCRKLSDLLEHEDDVSVDDISILRVGRHFRLNEAVVAISGRDEEENLWIGRLSRSGDLLLSTAERPGSTVLTRGSTVGEDVLRTAAGLAVHYSKFRESGSAEVLCQSAGAADPQRRLLDVRAVDPTELQNTAAPA